MPINLSQYRENFRRVPVDLFYFDANKGIVKATLDVKYKPITQEWLDENERTNQQMQERMREGMRLSRVAAEARAESLKLAPAEDANPSHEYLDAETTANEALAQLEKFTEEANTYSKRLLAEHLHPILIDLDIIDEAADPPKPVEPTVEFLVTCDLEFLQDIAEAVKKRTFRASTN